MAKEIMSKYKDAIISILPLVLLFGIVFLMKGVEPSAHVSTQDYIDYNHKLKLYSIVPMLIMWGCTIYFLVKIVRDSKLSKIGKVLWFVFLFVFNIVALPIWYLYAKFR